MTNRTMYDSTNLDDIPATAEMVAGYVDGDYRALPADFARFPRAQHVRITVEPYANGRPTGYPFGQYLAASVIDREKGAFSAFDARRFVLHRNDFRAGTATVYVDRAGLPQVLSACRGRHYWLWIADWLQREPTAAEVDALVHELAGSGARLAAWQYANEGAYDVSLVTADDWHPAP